MYLRVARATRQKMCFSRVGTISTHTQTDNILGGEGRLFTHSLTHTHTHTHTKLNSVASVRKRTIPTERPPPVSEVSANFLRIEGATWSA
jgi:hypothetical protein